MPLNVAVIGSGNIGTDLMFKIFRAPELEMIALVGIDPQSDGLARARKHGVATIDNGIEGLVARRDLMEKIEVVFDATSAKAHLHNAPILEREGKFAIDLTPAAIGPYIVPPVNLTEHLDKNVMNVNMVTCGGQATIPIVYAISRVQPVEYAEIVATIASKSAGPGTRANIDEFTETTARGIEVVGKAKRGKAIIILNPAEPPLIMRDTVHAIVENPDREKITASVKQMVADVQEYVPGYKLKSDPLFDGDRVSVFLEVTGAAHYLPAYAGNLDIMTGAAASPSPLEPEDDNGKVRSYHRYQPARRKPRDPSSIHGRSGHPRGQGARRGRRPDDRGDARRRAGRIVDQLRVQRDERARADRSRLRDGQACQDRGPAPARDRDDP